jgi:hypothetical protein
MSDKSSVFSAFVGALLLLVLLPLIAVVLLLWLIATVGIYILVWMLWCTRGKDMLFVYSDSPIWHDYIQEHIIPQIRARSVIVNWSERRQWLRRFSLSSLIFRHFGGNREFNPLAVYFPPLRRHRTFRFFQAFKDWKHGHPESLNRIESELFACIGLKSQSHIASG